MERRTAVIDGVELSYLITGDRAGGRPTVVCLPGWSQAAEQFVPVMERLGGQSTVVALDHRGHGRSSQPEGGYRVHRLAADLHGVLDRLELDDVTLLGHSMGVAVIWAYLDVFGLDRIDRLVFADQRPTLLRRPEWSDAEARIAGGLQTFEQFEQLCARLLSDDGWETLVGILRSMVSPELAASRFDELVATNRPATNATRAALWFDQCTIDWRDLIPTISVPSLVVHGMGSMIPLECQRWIVEVLPAGELATIPADEGGSHFAFWENPERFAELVAAFLPR